ncbi:methyl-accepting chemotaxis protein [Candidatus Magnetoovum chiemensis]|nr:methyl-accepting chemotaxis protein [Candidatus Magnetoovum chiemensis]
MEVGKICVTMNSIEEDMRSIQGTFVKNKEMSDDIGDAINSISTAIEEQSQVISDVNQRVYSSNSNINEIHKVLKTLSLINTEISKLARF